MSCRCDHDARTKSSNCDGDFGTGFRCVHETSIGESEVLSRSDTENLGRSFRFARSKVGRSARRRLAGREIDDRGAPSSRRRRKQRPAARQFNVVSVGGDSQNVDGHGRRRYWRECGKRNAEICG
jgi:hypothetical protein